MIPTLTVLFATNNVDSNCLGLCFNSETICARLVPFSSISSMSLACKEKKATSEPEISADNNNNRSDTRNSTANSPTLKLAFSDM